MANTVLNNIYNIVLEVNDTDAIIHSVKGGLLCLQDGTNIYNCTGFNTSKFDINNMSTIPYQSCPGMSGEPQCGDKVTNMAYVYSGYSSLTGSPVCGPNVTLFHQTYQNCSNLTGTPVCTDKISNLYFTYYNCSNLTGTPAVGNNVTDLQGTYAGCTNLGGGTTYWNKVTSCNVALYDIRKDVRTNVVVGVKDTYNQIKASDSSYLITGLATDWTDINNGDQRGFYNSLYNLYIYDNCEPF